MKIQANGLSKLTIEGFQDEALMHLVKKMQVAYNPTELPLTYGLEYERPTHAIQNATSELRFKRVRPQTLSLDLQFDADQVRPQVGKSVQASLRDLRQLCGVLDVASHQPRFLRVTWGAMDWNGDGAFIGRMEGLAVRYTLFDRNALPLRASATLSLIEDRQALEAQRKRHAVKAGGDVASLVQVPDKASLAMIAQKALSTGLGTMASLSVVSVLALAEANDMDHLDSFSPGQTLKWPSITGEDE